MESNFYSKIQTNNFIFDISHSRFYFLLFGREFLSLFTNEEAVIEAGRQRTRIMSFSYAVSAFMDCSIAACRGIGKSFVPTLIVVIGSCVFRIVWIYTVFAHFHTIPSLYLLYIFSWAITSVAEIISFAVYYKKLISKPPEKIPITHR